MSADDWIDFGILNETPVTQKRPAAFYRGVETTVELYGETYRAIVVHSSTHDKRRHKRIDRLLEQKRKDRVSKVRFITELNLIETTMLAFSSLTMINFPVPRIVYLPIIGVLFFLIVTISQLVKLKSAKKSVSL